MMPPGGNGGPMPPADLMRAIEERDRIQQREQAIQQWYDKQAARLEVEARLRTLKFAAILCRCLQREPCPVHSNIMVTLDGSRVL